MRLKKPAGSRNDILTVGSSDKVYEATKFGAVFDMLAGAGVAAEAILRGTNIPLADVHSPQARISLTAADDRLSERVAAVDRPSSALSHRRVDPHLDIRNVRLCAAVLPGLPQGDGIRDALPRARCAARRHRLQSRTRPHARWTIEPNLHALADSALYRFRRRDADRHPHLADARHHGTGLSPPARSPLAYPQAPDFDLPLDHVGCPVRFDRPANQIVFKAQWLDRSADLGNKTTYPTIVALCDDLLGDLKLRTGVAGQIRAILLGDIANPPTFEAIAKMLGVNDRSLRRQLRQQGFSFRGLHDELRTQIALKYLRNTALANEDIALALGFSDAANFRRAFHRWTNKAPSDIRGE